MKASPNHRFVLPLIGVLTAGIFIADLTTPLGVTGWIWYTVPLLLAMYAPGRFLPVGLASCFSVLITLAFLHSGGGPERQLELIGRGMGVGMLWIMGALLLARNRAEAMVRLQTT